MRLMAAGFWKGIFSEVLDFRKLAVPVGSVPGISISVPVDAEDGKVLSRPVSRTAASCTKTGNQGEMKNSFCDGSKLKMTADFPAVEIV